MLAEVLIYLPSVARFRKVYLEDQLAKAHLAALVVEASPDAKVTDPLAMDLLRHAGAHAIVLKQPARRMLMLSDDIPSEVDMMIDLRTTTFFEWIGGAVMTLLRSDNCILRVVGVSPRDPGVVVEVMLDEIPLRTAMYAFSWRILTLSIVISVITAALVYLVLQWWMVRPITRLTLSMVRFSADPEDERITLRPSGRSDELGVAERELASMQAEVRQALRQKARLAALGTAVAKIHHDLRNTLATAVLASDRLSTIDDPEVQRLAPRLYQAVDRAVQLTSRTLEFAKEAPAPLRETEFPLRDLLHEVDEIVAAANGRAPRLVVGGTAVDAAVAADREQLFRVFSNLTLNAAQAGARTVQFQADTMDGSLVVDVKDDGPGIPERALDGLFVPFAAGGRSGGIGLGLVIAREIVAAHGGALRLVRSDSAGTVFRVQLPLRRARAAAG